MQRVKSTVAKIPINKEIKAESVAVTKVELAIFLIPSLSVVCFIIQASDSLSSVFPKTPPKALHCCLFNSLFIYSNSKVSLSYTVVIFVHIFFFVIVHPDISLNFPPLMLVHYSLVILGIKSLETASF